MTPLTSVIVPVRNGERTLGDCLASLLRSDFPQERLEVLVVDNGSSDRTPEIAAELGVRVVREPRAGLSHARNHGIEEAHGELLAFTDADCVVTRRWLAELVGGLGDDAVAAATGRTLAFPPRTPAERYVARRKTGFGEWSEPHPLPYFVFGNAAVRREVFERVAPFDPRFKGGAEDIDLAWRFFEAGYELCRRPRAIVFHRHRASAGGLFRQHVGYGRGQATLVRKHPERLSWSWRREVGAWADLAAAGAQVAVALARERGTRRSMDLYYPYFDLLRKLGQRVGFLRGLLTER